MATNPLNLPLYEKIRRKNTIPRTVELLLLFLLLSLVVYRVFSLHHHGIAWLVALLCESWFTFIWILVVAIKWTTFDYKTYPQRLSQRITDLPRVDMFVTTADPVLEPPILTVNTVLSLLAVDYPANKLACYVSDDGCSPVIFYSLVEATKFAKLWVPFCKKYEVSVRAPFRYFSAKSSPYQSSSIEFQQEWKRMKDGYEELCRKIEKASEKSMASDITGDFGDVERNNHPTIIKVISENKEGDIPVVVYISREKRPNHPHHYKAGAMNVLTRVSGLMTNAPFMLNVDCDMFANNSQIVLHAMCQLLGVKNEKESGFVQFPQSFYDGITDDPFGNQMVVLYEYMGRGIAGIQGPFYGGTGCFHRRKVIYGLPPQYSNKEKLDEAELQRKYGTASEFAKSAAHILYGSTKNKDDDSVLINLEAAKQVAGIGYEFGTSWGKQLGWIYGSTTEDVLTGLTIHGRGWKSEYLPLEPAGFLGCAPSGGPASTTQMKRWATGLLEIIFTSKSPIIATLNGNLQFRQCLAYLWILVWALRSIPEIVYAILPAYCIITNSSFLPKINDHAILLPISIFVIYNLYTLSEYIRMGQSIRAWWNNQRMWRVNAMTAWLFGLLSVVLKLLGLSQTVFEVTQKDQTNSEDDIDVNVGRYTFDGSPIFVSGTSILLVNLVALATALLGFRPVGNIIIINGGDFVGVGEILTSVVVVLCFSVFFKGLFGKGKYGIPSATIFKALVLGLLFLHFCKWGSIS